MKSSSMSAEPPVREPIGSSQKSAVSPEGRRRKMKLVLLLVSIGFSVATFLALDWFRTSAIRRTHQAKLTSGSCWVYDPVRHHALKPNCASTEHWGKDSYEFVTNSLGFRDEKIRDVPLAVPRPEFCCSAARLRRASSRGATAM